MAEQQPSQPWPRFVRPSPGLLPMLRQPGPYEPWPRWGWFPREQRTWTFAPGPSLIAHNWPSPPPAAGAARGNPPEDATPEDTASGSAEPIVARPVKPRFMQGFREQGLRDESAPAEWSSTTALVPVRREIVLSNVTRAARRAAPVAAVAGVVAVAALALFRRR